MPDQTPNIHDLEQQLQRLLQRQADFQREIEQLRHSINQFKAKPLPSAEEPKSIKKPIAFPREEVLTPPKVTSIAANIPFEEPEVRPSWSLERFIGENLMNKVGILILVFGIAFGICIAGVGAG